MGSARHNCENESSIISIGLDDFHKEVLEENRPVLVLCMNRDFEFHEQIEVIEGVCRSYGKRLKTCLMEEEFIRGFKEKFGIKGTPTFMIFIGGIEKGRMLGQAERKALEDFVSRTLSLDRDVM